MKTTSLFFLIALILQMGCSNKKLILKPDALPNGKIVVSTISDETPHPLKIALVVANLENNSPHASWNHLESALADMMAVDLSHYPELNVIERKKLAAILIELNLGEGGVTDPQTAQRVGKLIGANVFAFGSFTQFGKGDIVLTVRLTKVETGELIGGVTETGKSIEKIGELSHRVSEKIVNAIRASK